MATPILIVLSGPNGAGKSTYFEYYLRPTWGKLRFINADLIAREKWPGDEERKSYDAAREADRQRDEAFARRGSFITETVFSHESKLDLLRHARTLGYFVRVFYVGIDSPVLSEHRVRHRVRHGGHSVPVEKLAARYQRSLALLPAVVKVASQVTVIDNSHATPYLDVLECQDGKVIRAASPLPKWLAGVMKALRP